MKKISLFAVMVAAVVLVLSGCGRGPGIDDMEMPDDMPMAPAYVGTWYFSGAVAVDLEATAFTVTAGDGTTPLGTEGHFAMLTKIVVKGTVAAQGEALMLTVGTDENSIELTFADTVPEAEQGQATAAITELLMQADDQPVMIAINAEADPVTMTVTGSFTTTLLGMPPGTPLTACKGQQCPVCDSHGRSYWQAASAELVTACLRARLLEVEALNDDGETPLHRAAQFNGSPAVIKVLVDAGADVNAPRNDGKTPLHSAARGNDNPAIIAALVDAGADVNAEDDRGKTPLHDATDPNIVAALRAAGAECGEGYVFTASGCEKSS